MFVIGPKIPNDHFIRTSQFQEHGTERARISEMVVKELLGFSAVYQFVSSTDYIEQNEKEEAEQLTANRKDIDKKEYNRLIDS